MMACFIMNENSYDNTAKVLITLNKMSKGRGATFSEGWYHKIFDNNIPLEQNTFKRLSEDFHQAFVLKDLQDRAHQEIYSLSMNQVNGDFDQYVSAFQLAQMCSGLDMDSILVDALQQGVSNQLAIMVTAATLLPGQETTGWKWEQWLEKTGEFYRNVVWLQELRKGDNCVAPENPPQKWVPSWKNKTTPNPDAMDVDQMDLSPYERRRHIKEDRCFQCHEPRCRLWRHLKGPERRRTAEEGNLQTASPQWINSPMIPTILARSITIPVELYKTKNGRILETRALIDSRETISCIDHHLVNRMKWPLKKPPQPMNA